MHRITNKRNNKIKRTIKKRKCGGKKYKHKRVGLFCKPTTTEYPISCNVCGINDYIERNSTLGKSKGNQAVVNFFVGDTVLEDINNITINAYFCIKCGMSKIIRGDKDYIYTREYKSQ